MAAVKAPHSLNMKELTPSQKDAIQEIRTILADDLEPEIDDQKILKFLIARNFEVNNAASMLKRHLEYWKKIGIHHLLYEYTPDEKSQHFATVQLGFDKDGSMVRLLRVGMSDVKGLALSHSKVEAVIMAAHLLETDKQKQKERFQETGEGGDDKQVYIIDLEGLRWRVIFFRPLIQLFVLMLRLYEGNYPESLKTAYVVNAPSFFSLIYNFIKSILPSEILNKVQILSSDQFNTVLTSAMDPDILPKFLGGNRTDPDGNPYCNTLFPVVPGTPVPQEYYLTACLDKDPEAKKTTVMAQSTFSVTHKVDTPKSVLLWDFQTQDNDIAMGLLLRKNGIDEPKWLIPSKRVDSHRFIESGRFRCEEPGTYELVFDNSYSWWAKKELTYKTVVLNPGEHEKEKDIVF